MNRECNAISRGRGKPSWHHWQGMHSDGSAACPHTPAPAVDGVVRLGHRDGVLRAAIHRRAVGAHEAVDRLRPGALLGIPVTQLPVLAAPPGQHRPIAWCKDGSQTVRRSNWEVHINEILVSCRGPPRTVCIAFVMEARPSARQSGCAPNIGLTAVISKRWRCTTHSAAPGSASFHS